MIDQGFCFNAGEWNFPDAPLRGLYARNRVYEGVTGMESFAPWLEPLEKHTTGSVLDEISKEIPPTWYDDDYDALANVLQLAPQKGVLSGDLDAELERLYADHVAVARGSGRVGAPAWVPKLKQLIH